MDMTADEAIKVIKTQRGCGYCYCSHTDCADDNCSYGEALNMAIVALEEYSRNHRPIHDPTLDNTFDKINEALDINLYYWQKTYIEYGEFRCMGMTTAKILSLLLCRDSTPLDCSRLPQTNKQAFERRQLWEMQQKLGAAGINTRKIYWSEKDKRERCGQR